MEDFPDAFTFADLCKTAFPERANRLRKNVYDGVVEAMARGAETFVFDTVPGIPPPFMREILKDLCVRFPNRVMCESDGYLNSWGAIENSDSSQIYIRYAIDLAVYVEE